MLSMAKPIKIKVLLRQFSLLMFNLRYIFLFVLLLDRGIAGIREMPHYNYPEGFEGRGEGKQKNNNNNNNNNKKQDAMGAFFPACFLPCTSRSPGRYSRRLACLRSHVLRAYCNIDAQFYSNFAFELNVNTLKIF